MARSLEIANQMAAPNQPGPSRCDRAWFEIEPQRAPGPMWLLESADRSRVGVVVVSKTLRNVRVCQAPINLLLETIEVDEKSNPLRNEAALNCVALRSQLEHEVTWRAVKGPDERPLRDALDSSPRHHRRIMQMESN